MRLYKNISVEEYQVRDEDESVLRVVYMCYYNNNNGGKSEKIELHLPRARDLIITTVKGEKSNVDGSVAGEKLDDKVLAAIEELPMHVNQLIKRALEK